MQDNMPWQYILATQGSKEGRLRRGNKSLKSNPLDHTLVYMIVYCYNQEMKVQNRIRDNGWNPLSVIMVLQRKLLFFSVFQFISTYFILYYDSWRLGE